MSSSLAHNCIALGKMGMEEAMRANGGCSSKNARKDKPEGKSEKNQHLEALTSSPQG